ncbi:hypothetical protein ACWGB8_38010 [Kitasatospora sp. NPDC054939]
MGALVAGALAAGPLLAGCGAQPGEIPYSAIQGNSPTPTPSATPAVAVAAPSAGPAAAQAVTARNGLIAGRVLLDADSRSSAIFTVAPDGSSEQRLTEPPEGARDDHPDWSPDGGTLVFDRTPDGSTATRLWTVSAAGQGARQIGALCETGAIDCANESESSPAFSPDGKMLAFSRTWGSIDESSGSIQFSDLYVMAPDGTNAQRLTFLTNDKPYSGRIDNPSWSPDGTQLTFEYRTSGTGQPANGRAVFVVNADGTGLRQLTPWDLRAGERADWSPDGTQIVFTTFPAGADNTPGGGIYTVRPDGTAIGALTPSPSDASYGLASYSPDGRSIVFAQAAADGTAELFTMNSDGTSPTRLTNTADSGESRPSWGAAPPAQ